MKNSILISSTLAACLAFGAASAQDLMEGEEETAIEQESPVSEEDLLAHEGAEVAIDEALNEQDLASQETDEPSLAEAQKTPEQMRQELSVLIGLPVKDREGKRIGITENIILEDGASRWVVVKLDNMLFGNKLRAVPSVDAAAIEDGTAIGLTVLNKAELKAQAGFAYTPDMDTLAPVPGDRTGTDRNSQS